MKRKGFTLAEVLTALCIIGIVSALMIPAIGNIKPNDTKITYLKAYDSLVEATNMFINDTSIYSPVYITDTQWKPNGDPAQEEYTLHNVTYNVEKYPLLSMGEPINTQYNSFNNNIISSFFRGKHKYTRLLLSYLMGDLVGTCDDKFSSCTFTTANGKVNWEVTVNGDGLTTNTYLPSSVTYSNTVNVTINNKTFTFFVLADGEIIPADTQGQAYIANRTKVKGKDDSVTGYTAKTLNDTGIKKTFEVGSSSDIQLLNDESTGTTHSFYRLDNNPEDNTEHLEHD